jgi:hypothetical protein
MKVCPHSRQPMPQQGLRAGSVTADPAARCVVVVASSQTSNT